jgi:hypothetical protein
MARMSYAQAACAALERAMSADPHVVALGEDVGRGGIFGQYRGLQQKFGAGRVIDTPISATIMALRSAWRSPETVVGCVVDFALCAMDEIVKQAAKARFMFGGQACAARRAHADRHRAGSAAQHSQNLKRGSRTSGARRRNARRRRFSTATAAAIDSGDGDLHGAQGTVGLQRKWTAERGEPARRAFCGRRRRDARYLVAHGARRAQAAEQAASRRFPRRSSTCGRSGTRDRDLFDPAAKTAVPGGTRPCARRSFGAEMLPSCRATAVRVGRGPLPSDIPSRWKTKLVS